MKTHVEDLARVIEDILSSITMVNIPVENQDFFALVCRILSSNCNIIEEAEALDIFTVRMVAWRTYYAVASIMSRLLR